MTTNTVRVDVFQGLQKILVHERNVTTARWVLMALTAQLGRGAARRRRRERAAWCAGVDVHGEGVTTAAAAEWAC
jgi:hypothetical protein